MITVGSSGTLGIGGIVITEGSGGRWWWCSGSWGVWGCCWVGACRGGGAAGGAALDGALDDALLVVLLVVVELVELVVLVALDELVAGVVPPPGPRLVSWMMPQITSASITAISPTQAISTGLRRNQGVGGCAESSPASVAGAGGCSTGW